MFRSVGVLSVLALICSAPLWAAPPDQSHVLRFGGAVGDTPLSGDVSLPSQITVEAWIRLEAYGTGGLPSIAGRRHSGDPFIDFEIGLDSPGRRLELRMSTGQPGTQRSVTSNGDLPLNAWTHVAATFDGNTMRLFQDGELRASDAAVGAPPATGTERFTIGSGVHGLLRQVRIWSHALTAAELIDRSSRTVAATEVGLVHSWPLDEGDGQVARDRVVPGVNLRLGSTDDFDENDPRWARTVLIDSGPYYVLDGPLSIWEPTCVNADAPVPCPNTAKLIDFDHDGDLDVVANRSDFDFKPTPMIAIRNDRTSFVDVTATVFPQPVMTIANSDYVVGDFNRDGLPDLFIEEVGIDRPPFAGGQNQLLVGSVTGQLLNETAQRLPQVLAFTHSATAADVDGDGDLDLYIGNICCGNGAPALLINDGSGRFASEPGRLPSSVIGSPAEDMFTASLFIDHDGDGDPDLFLGPIGNNMPRDRLLINDGTGRFATAVDATLPLRPEGAMSATAFAVSADFDRDGRPDIAMWQQPHDTQRPRIVLYFNNGDGTFRDGSARVDTPPWPEWGLQNLHPIDINGDGWIDLVAEGVMGPSRLLLNVFGSFVDVSEVLPSFLPGVRVLLPGDLDLDGDIDFYAHTGPHAFRVISVKLIDTRFLVKPRRRAVRH